MENYISTYFDIIPLDIINIIISKLDTTTDILEFKEVSYKLSKTIDNINIWKSIFKNNMVKYYYILNDITQFITLNVYDYIYLYINLKIYNNKYNKIDYIEKLIIDVKYHADDMIFGGDELYITTLIKQTIDFKFIYDIIYREKVSMEYKNFYNLIKGCRVEANGPLTFLKYNSNPEVIVGSMWHGIYNSEFNMLCILN
jgi:hypothetical protein